MAIEKIQLVFMHTQAEGTNRAYRYGEISEGKIIGERVYRKALAAATPGTILEADGERDGEKLIVHTNTIRYCGVWDDETDRLRWQAKNRDASMIVEGQKKMKDGDLLENSLDQLRTAYRQLPGSSRQRFIAWVVYKIIGG